MGSDTLHLLSTAFTLTRGPTAPVGTAVKNCALLGYYAVSSSNSVPTFRDKRCYVGVIFKGTLKMAPTGCPETSVRNYYYKLRNSPEERSSHLLHGESPKPRLVPGCLPRGGDSKENGAARQSVDGN